MKLAAPAAPPRGAARPLAAEGATRLFNVVSGRRAGVRRRFSRGGATTRLGFEGAARAVGTGSCAFAVVAAAYFGAVKPIPRWASAAHFHLHRAVSGASGASRRACGERAREHAVSETRDERRGCRDPGPPHSLQWRRTLPCSQMLAPPHSLQWLRTLPCSQKPEPRTPCSTVAPSRARRSSPRTPCSGLAASRARGALSPRHLARVPSLAPAVHARPIAPRPPADRGRFPRATLMAEPTARRSARAAAASVARAHVR